MSSLPARILGALALGLSLACAAAPVADDASLPTPYTAEEIRLANAPGTVRVFRITQPGAPVMIQRMHFVSDDGEQTRIETTMADADGNVVGQAITGDETWENLRLHASFPAEAATRADAACEVRGGHFACTLYTVTEGNRVSRFWFAASEPGPPVLMTVEADGMEVMRMELLEVERP